VEGSDFCTLTLTLTYPWTIPSGFCKPLTFSRTSPHVRGLLAGTFDIWSGFVNILKHSARLSLQVIVGSKIVSPWVLRAASFRSLRVFVRERLSRLLSV
jgi:hypothetical protein